MEEGGRLGRKVGGWGGRWEVREEGGRYGRKVGGKGGRREVREKRAKVKGGTE